MAAPLVRLTADAALKLRYAVQHTPGMEVGGFGRTVVNDRQEVIVTDIIVPPQIAGSAHTDIEVQDLDELLAFLARRGESLADWRLWWHSHGRMGAFASGQDVSTLDMLASHLGWFAGIVTNVEGKFYSWMSFSVPPMLRTSFQIELKIESYENEDLKREIDEQMKRVERPVTKSYTNYVSQYHGGNAGGNNGGNNTGFRALPLSDAPPPQRVRVTGEGKTKGGKKGKQDALVPVLKSIQDMSDEEFVAWVNNNQFEDY